MISAYLPSRAWRLMDGFDIRYPPQRGLANECQIQAHGPKTASGPLILTFARDPPHRMRIMLDRTIVSDGDDDGSLYAGRGCLRGDAPIQVELCHTRSRADVVLVPTCAPR